MGLFILRLNLSTELYTAENGPSSAFAGDGERLPGIGSKPNPFSVGSDWRMVSRICDETADVSHESEPSS